MPGRKANNRSGAKAEVCLMCWRNQVWLEQMSGKRYMREEKRPNYARHCQDLGFYWE